MHIYRNININSLCITRGGSFCFFPSLYSPVFSKCSIIKMHYFYNQKKHIIKQVGKKKAHPLNRHIICLIDLLSKIESSDVSLLNFLNATMIRMHLYSVMEQLLKVNAVQQMDFQQKKQLTLSI